MTYLCRNASARHLLRAGVPSGVIALCNSTDAVVVSNAALCLAYLARVEDARMALVNAGLCNAVVPLLDMQASIDGHCYAIRALAATASSGMFFTLC